MNGDVSQSGAGGASVGGIFGSAIGNLDGQSVTILDSKVTGNLFRIGNGHVGGFVGTIEGNGDKSLTIERATVGTFELDTDGTTLIPVSRANITGEGTGAQSAAGLIGGITGGTTQAGAAQRIIVVEDINIYADIQRAQDTTAAASGLIGVVTGWCRGGVDISTMSISNVTIAGSITGRETSGLISILSRTHID